MARIRLGESVDAALGTAKTEWGLASAMAAVHGFLAVAGLRSVSFDAGAGAGPVLGPGSTGVNVAYAHLPRHLILAAVGAGVALLIVEAGAGHLGAGTRWALCGGVVRYPTTLRAIHLATARSLRDSVLGARLAAELASYLLAVAGGLLPPLAVVGLLLAALSTLAGFELVRDAASPPAAEDDAGTIGIGGPAPTAAVDGGGGSPQLVGGKA